MLKDLYLNPHLDHAIQMISFESSTTQPVSKSFLHPTRHPPTPNYPPFPAPFPWEEKVQPRYTEPLDLTSK